MGQRKSAGRAAEGIGRKMNKKKMRRVRTGIRKMLLEAVLFFPVFLVCIPILLILTGGFMARDELREGLSPVFTGMGNYIRWSLMPDYPTFENYRKMLFETPQFFVLFWNSVKMTGCILAGQLLIGCRQHGLLRYTAFPWAKLFLRFM